MKIISLLLTVTAAVSAQSPAFRWTGPLAAGERLEIRGIHGPVMVEAGSAVEVTATKRRGRRGEPEAVKIEVTKVAGGVVICALYPQKDGRVANSCTEPSQGSTNNDTQVEFRAKIPAGMAVKLASVHGNVEARGLTGAVSADSVHGDVRVEGGTVARANTVHGNVEVSMRKLDEKAGGKYSSVHGDVRVKVASLANADFSAGTVHGTVKSDYPVTMSGAIDRHSLKGKIGAGGPKLELSTVHGSVALTR